MRIFITKVWNWWDVWMLKWCAFLFGIAAGAYFHDYVMPYPFTEIPLGDVALDC
jgi:hypothetical protein